MQLTLEQFQQAAESKKFAPVYFIYGDEELVIAECVNALLQNALPPEEMTFNCDILHGADVNAADVVSLANSFPMMSERRLVIVKDFEKLSGKEPRKGEEPDDVPFIRYIKNPSPSTVLALIGEDPDLRKSPYPQIAKNAQVLRIKKFYERETAKWIEGRVKAKGKTITPEGSALLLEHAGLSLRTIDNEIEKLCIYLSERARITDEDVRHIVGISNEASVFDLEKAVGEKKLADALRIMTRVLAEETPQAALGGLLRLVTRIHKILIATAASGRIDKTEIATAIGANPRNFSLIDSYIRYARNFTPPLIDAAFAALRRADTMMKTTQADANTILGEAILVIVGKKN